MVQIAIKKLVPGYGGHLKRIDGGVHQYVIPGTELDAFIEKASQNRCSELAACLFNYDRKPKGAQV